MMECTQRLECTQELYESRTEKLCPEQIGFLGICGVKHPVKRGPNKIGRDPQTCSIVLNLNSISRQHAVINVLNKTEFMLMDLDSANKTKLMDKTLPAYIPHPLRNGDMIQFGDVFGVFRLLEEDNDLPMTQAIDLPETPVPTRHMSKLNNVHVTTIPESPDVSDREESFIAPSQPKKEKCFKNSNSNHFIKPSSKVISIQPVGSNKIDNVYWNSSKKSVSLNSQFDESSMNKSTLSDRSRESNDASIFEMETQPPNVDANDSVDSIYTANTQVPSAPLIHSENTQLPAPSPSIHTADTQVPSTSPSIHNVDTQIPTALPSVHMLDTQLPSSTNHLPEVCKIDNQQELQFDLYASDKKNTTIYDADTQASMVQNDESAEPTKTFEKSPSKSKIADKITKNLNMSDEVILFDELDCDQFEDDFASQPLLPQNSWPEDKVSVDTKTSENIEGNNEVKKDVIIHSDSSTDCEDIDMLPTQKITENKINEDEDLTDCEDLFSDPKPQNNIKSTNKQTEHVDFEDMLTQVIDDDLPSKPGNDVNFEEIPTQVIVPKIDNKLNFKEISLTVNKSNLEDMPTQIILADDDVIITEKKREQKDISFEDMPTQVITAQKDSSLEDMPTQVITSKEEGLVQNEGVKDFVSPFKVPLMSPIKLKRKDIQVFTPKSNIPASKPSPVTIPGENDNYYETTQDILDDLCSQRISDETVDPKIYQSIKNNNSGTIDEDYETGKRFPHLENTSPKKKQLSATKSSESSDGEEKVNSFVTKLSCQQIRDMVGIEPLVANIKRASSDPSDVELTPKKIRFMDIDLPSSQEIKSNISVYKDTLVTESSSDSDVENCSEECTPIVFRKNKKPKAVSKLNLTKVFNAPERILTRVRKPTQKLLNNELSNNILKSMYLIDQEDDVDKEIIRENIKKHKTKTEKSTKKDVRKESKRSEKLKDEKENATSSETVDDKDKITAVKNTKSEGKTKIKQDDVIVKDNQEDKTKTTKRVDSHSKSKRKEMANKESRDVPSKTTKSEIEIANKKVETGTILRNTRTTRNRQKAEETVDVSPISICEKDKSQIENRSKSRRQQNIKIVEHIDLTEKVVEIRRSGRQKKETDAKMKTEKPSDKIEKNVKTSEKTVKSSENTVKSTEKSVKTEKLSDKDKKHARKRGRPPKHEQSTVYSMSSDSGHESPRNAKRSATEDLGPPSPKRTRSVATAGNLNSSLRATPARMNKTHNVLFTAFPCEEVKDKLEKLGAVIVSDVSKCTVVLTMQVKRTFKLLCAVGLGLPIVGPNWVQACADTNMIVDPWLYILKDEAAEKRFQFNLERTLTGKRNFLKGYNVSATPSVMPSAPEMKLIVESSGGSWQEAGPAWVCVSCGADKAQWPALRRRGAIVVSTEFILGGVLRQRADVTPNKLQ